MLRAQSIATLFTATLLLGACAQLIGLGEYEAVEGSAGKGGKGGSAGSAGKGGSSGAGGRGGGGGTGGSSGAASAGESGSGGVSGSSSGEGGDAGSSSGEAGVGNAGRGGTGDAGGSGGTGGTGGSAGGGEGGEGGRVPRVCPEVALGAVIAVDDVDVPAAVQYFTEYTPGRGDPGGDFVAVDFYHGSGYNGGLKGAFDLSDPEDAQYRTCSRCVRVFQDLNAIGGKIFFQESGTVVVDQTSDQMNENPVVQLTDITLVEVEIADDYTSTVVPGGECVRIPQATISIPPGELMWDEDECDLLWRGDALCDCGCGALDTDCTASTGDQCTACFCGTEDDPLPCNAEQNWLCDEAPVTP